MDLSSSTVCKTIECNICYNLCKNTKIIKCYYNCTSNICIKCFSKCLKINFIGQITYKCPFCNQIVINSSTDTKQDRKFTRSCYSSIYITKEIFKLYTSEVFELNEKYEDEEYDYNDEEYEDESSSEESESD